MTGPEYLKEHGINKETIAKFDLTWDEDFLNIPIRDVNGAVIWIKHRNLKFNPKNPESSKYKNDSGSTAALFNIDKYKDNGVLVLAEGEMDAIRLAQENIPAVSVTAGAETFNRELGQQLEGKTVYICYDTDGGGIKGTRKVLEFLPNAKVVTLPLEIKDTSDYFQDNHDRKDFINLVKKALPGKQWLTLNPIEEYSTITIRKLYEKEYPDEEFIIDKFVPTEGIIMFSGDAGVGKSFMGLEVAKAVSNNVPFLNHFAVNFPNSPVLIIDKENGMKRIQKRMKGMQIDPCDNVYLLKYPEKFTLEDGKFMQYLQDFIQINQIKIVILDSFIDVLIGNENAAPDVSLVFNALRSISTEVCWVIMHHESKPMPKFHRIASDRARGSSNIKAQVDYLFSIQRTKDLKVIHIEQGKARDYALLPKFAVEFLSESKGDMEGFSYIGEVKDDSSAVDEAITFVEEYLGNSPNKSRQDVIDTGEAEGISGSAIKRALAMLQDKKIVGSMQDPIKKNRKLFFIRKEEEDSELPEGGLFQG
jgi:hypothetical protein